MNQILKKYRPLVSIILPTYKRDINYLSRAVNSILSQTYDNIEIIVIDDNPINSEYRKYVECYMDSIVDVRVKYYQNERNIGGSLSRNKGIYLSTGELITFLDDDDEYMPEKIEKQVDFILKYRYELIFSDIVIYNSNGFVVDYRGFSDIKSFDNEYLLRYHLTRHMTGTPTFMFKSECIKRIGGFDDVKMGQEFRLMLKSIENDIKIGYLNECYVKVHKHTDGGISQGSNKIIGEEELYEFKKKYFDRLTKEEIRFIKFRHLLVMAVAHYRNKNYINTFVFLVLSIIKSPKNFIVESRKNICGIYKYKKMEGK